MSVEDLSISPKLNKRWVRREENISCTVILGEELDSFSSTEDEEGKED